MSTYGYLVHSELYHHGIKGMKWGIRRYQNPDGSLTPEGEKRYYTYKNAKKSDLIKKAGFLAGAGAGIGNLAYLLASANKKNQYIKGRTKEEVKAYDKKSNIISGVGTAGALGVTLGAIGLGAYHDNKIDNIIKRSSDDEFNKIANDKRFRHNELIQLRKKFGKIDSSTNGYNSAKKYLQSDAYKKYRKELRRYTNPRSSDFNPDAYDEYLNDVQHYYNLSDSQIERLKREVSHSALSHHGIKGQKWGVRRYQNPDGSLTDAGKRRYAINLFEKNPQHWYRTGYGLNKQARLYRDVRKANKKENKGISNDDLDKLINKEYKKIYKKDANLEYNLGKSSYEYQNGAYKYGGGALGAGATLIEAKVKGKEHPYSAHVRYTNEILRKNGYKGFR